MAKSVADIIQLADVTQNPLRPTNLKADLSFAAGSLVLLQVYANQALQQSTINPSVISGDGQNLLPLVAQHQLTAKRNAAYLLETIAPTALATLTDVLAYASLVDSFTDAIVALLPAIIDSPAARAQVLALLGQLSLEADKRDNAAREAGSQLSVALAKVEADKAAFESDVRQADKEIASKDGALEKIQGDIADAQRRITGEIAGIVISALVATAGGVVIGIGALATLPAGVTGASVILPGVGLLATGAAGLTAAATQLAGDNGKLASLYLQAAELSVTLTLIKAISSQVQSVADASSGMADAASSLSTEWSSIRTGIASFRDQVTRAEDQSDAAHIITAVKLAQQDWQSITRQTQSLLARLVDLAPQDVANVLQQKQKAA